MKRCGDVVTFAHRMNVISERRRAVSGIVLVRFRQHLDGRGALITHFIVRAHRGALRSV